MSVGCIGESAPRLMAFPAGSPAPAPAQPQPSVTKPPSPPIADPFSPRGAKRVQAFDPLLFHRTFCPWVNSGTDSGASPGAIAGLLKVQI